VSALGIVLMVVGAALVVAEAHTASHGALAGAGAIAIAAGLAAALSAAGAAGIVVLLVAVATALAGLALAGAILRTSLRMTRRAVRSGPRALVGRVATVRRVPAPLGQVQLDGALWSARLWGLEDDERAVAEGDAVVVDRVDGLTLTVRPAEEWEVLP
jgi:membrane-bound serine protease (ClpP class)